MVAITFISHDKNRYEVEGKVGSTLMETAIKHNVPGIEAECGGACSCATCHVYLPEPWYDIAGEPSEMEEDMLDFAIDVNPQSRLSCQIKVSDDLNGIEVHIPESQG